MTVNCGKMSMEWLKMRKHIFLMMILWSGKVGIFEVQYSPMPVVFHVLMQTNSFLIPYISMTIVVCAGFVFVTKCFL